MQQRAEDLKMKFDPKLSPKKCARFVADVDGVQFLAFDSSITAVPFYKRMGYDVIESGSHSLSSGLKMACFKMRKDL